MLAVCGICGCAATTRLRPIGTPADYRFVGNHQGITVAVEPIVIDEDLRALLTRVPSRNILPMRIIIFNQGQGVVRFSCTQAKICLPDKTILSTMPPSEVSKDLEGDESAAATVLVIVTGGYGGAIAAGVSRAAAEGNWKAQKAARKCSMELATVNPGEALTGYLFYNCPESRQSYVERSSVVELKISRMPRSDGSPLEFAIPVSLANPKEDKP